MSTMEERMAERLDVVKRSREMLAAELPELEKRLSFVAEQLKLHQVIIEELTIMLTPTVPEPVIVVDEVKVLP